MGYPGRGQYIGPGVALEAARTLCTAIACSPAGRGESALNRLKDEKSFEDSLVAWIMNTVFVSITVDRCPSKGMLLRTPVSPPRHG